MELKYPIMSKTLFYSIILFLSSLSMFMSNSLISLTLPISIISSNFLSISIIIDWISLLFSATVLLISSAILIFSKSYIPKKHHKRFFIILLSFVLSMILLIFSNNIFFMMLGWDGLGLTSYALVMFYMNTKSKESGAITILSNRVGDILIIMSIGISLSNGSMELFLSKEFPTIMIILIIIAAFTKSAQFPFSAWLPAAMAAPTPISALVHSSTLVTAGAFIMIRSMTFNFSSLSLILIISTITMFISGMSANWEQDFKKVIALSTLSQMAMIMFAISINIPTLAFFHLITHAMFKSTMFICAGYIIHNSSYQDIRYQGLNSNFSPSLITNFNITNMSLMGLPFLAGYFSKDSIIESLMHNKINPLIMMFILISIGLTASYSMRLSSFSMSLSQKSKPDSSFYHDNNISTPINFMTPMSIILGSTLSWLMFPFNFISIPITIKLSITLMILTGFLLGMLLSFKSKKYLFQSSTQSSLWFLNFLSSSPQLQSLNTGQISISMDKSWMNSSSALGLFNLLSSLCKYPEAPMSLLLISLLMSLFIPTTSIYLISLIKAIYWS